MKICNKCRKKLPPDYIQVQYPAFYIRKMTQISMITGEEINLCHSCSLEFEEWLNKNEYEPKVVDDMDGFVQFLCGNCNNYIDYEYDHYCPQCGKKIKEVTIK